LSLIDLDNAYTKIKCDKSFAKLILLFSFLSPKTAYINVISFAYLGIMSFIMNKMYGTYFSYI